MIDFRKKKEALKNEVNKLHDEVKAKNDTVLRVLCPALDNVKNDLTMNMNQQAEMNEEIQEEILDSKDEFQKVNDTIIDFRERVQCLEEDLGLYHG